MPPARWVYSVEYRDERCKKDAIGALNAIEGVSAENDNRRGLSRDVTVNITGDADPRIPGKILVIFGSIRRKQLIFRLTFGDGRRKNDALRVVKALKGVDTAEFERVDGIAAELILKVAVSADPQIVPNILENYGAQIL